MQLLPLDSEPSTLSCPCHLLKSIDLASLLVALSAQPTQFADNLLKESVDLLIVIPFAKLCRTESLPNYVIGVEWH
ncbi:hypothetical protein SAMN05421879_101348 [Ornithinimicrobium cerasi]|uniref:Uncharacterized protein n=1 Tax=Ornithinimicrobium cerasi TaxID=2248773 RepID=A0A285VCN9_9MICO|nr:hypothetical protein SAMN05421879_101348 [Ornithinimicrobium cerasi]